MDPDHQRNRRDHHARGGRGCRRQRLQWQRRRSAMSDNSLDKQMAGVCKHRRA